MSERMTDEPPEDFGDDKINRTMREAEESPARNAALIDALRAQLAALRAQLAEEKSTRLTQTVPISVPEELIEKVKGLQGQLAERDTKTQGDFDYLMKRADDLQTELAKEEARADQARNCLGEIARILYPARPADERWAYVPDQLVAVVKGLRDRADGLATALERIANNDIPAEIGANAGVIGEQMYIRLIAKSALSGSTAALDERIAQAKAEGAAEALEQLALECDASGRGTPGIVGSTTPSMLVRLTESAKAISFRERAAAIRAGRQG